MADRPPLPPFTRRDAPPQKVQAAEDAWNSRDPERVALAYTEDSVWRNRDRVRHRARRDRRVPHRASGSASTTTPCARRCGRSPTTASRCASSTSATTTTGSGGAATATRTGSSTPHGLMRRREASINDVAIAEADRRIFGPRPESERGRRAAAALTQPRTCSASHRRGRVRSAAADRERSGDRPRGPRGRGGGAWRRRSPGRARCVPAPEIASTRATTPVRPANS